MPVSTVAGGALKNCSPSAATTLDKLFTKLRKPGPGLGGCAPAATSSAATSVTCTHSARCVSSLAAADLLVCKCALVTAVFSCREPCCNHRDLQVQHTPLDQPGRTDTFGVPGCSRHYL